MPTSARTSLGFFGQCADVGIRAPEQNGLLQQALANNLINDLSMHIRESERAALVAISQPLVVEAQQMQHRCVQIMHVHRLLDDVVTKFIRAAVGDALLHAAAREQHGEGILVMVAAGLRAAPGLLHRRPAKLAAPDDECLVEQSALLQVLD